MVNTDDFTKRLHRVMEYYDLSAASFADRIDVGRSSISHLLSGRNKPSLDFVMKIIRAFPEVELYWLLNGKGKFPQEKKPEADTDIPRNETRPQEDLFTKQVSENKTSEESRSEDQHRIASTDKKKTIERIVIFYTDGTFDAFNN